MPTWVTVFARWPSLVDDVFPHWTKRRVERAMARVLGPHWKELPFPITVVYLYKRGLIQSLDDDPKDTLIKIRDLSDRLLLDELAAQTVAGPH